MMAYRERDGRMENNCMNPTKSHIVEYLKENFTPELILLGGSRAVGKERTNSDKE